MSFPKYESYKHSSAEWMCQIPSYWEIKQLRHICTCEDGKRIPLNAEERSGRQGEYPYWGANGIVDHVDEWLFDEELVLLGEDGAPFFEDNKTVSFLSQGKIWPNNHIHVLRPKEPRSGAYISHSLNAVDYSSAITGSTRDKLNQGAMNGIKLPWPPVNERKLIVIFLDRETAKIDTLIAEQQRLIELLQEKRQAVISHAVTKGLNPNVPMKDSGVEWLGEVPEHWDTKSLKYIVRMKSGDFITSDSIETEGAYPVFGGNGLRGFTDDFNREGAYALIGRQGALCGNVNAASGRFWASEHAIVCIHQNETDLAWLCNMLEAANLNQYSTSAAQPGLSVEVIGNTKVPCPPPSEQVAIGAWLEQELSKMDATIETANHLIAVLGERRSALISAAVIGQIDIRGLAIEEEQ